MRLRPQEANHSLPTPHNPCIAAKTSIVQTGPAVDVSNINGPFSSLDDNSDRILDAKRNPKFVRYIVECAKWQNAKLPIGVDEMRRDRADSAITTGCNNRAKARLQRTPGLLLNIPAFSDDPYTARAIESSHQTRQARCNGSSIFAACCSIDDETHVPVHGTSSLACRRLQCQSKDISNPEGRLADGVNEPSVSRYND